MESHASSWLAALRYELLKGLLQVQVEAAEEFDVVGATAREEFLCNSFRAAILRA